MIRAALLAMLCTSCIATSGELERAVTEITDRVDVVARDAQESAEAAREAYRQGSITYAELQQRLQDIRAATLDVAKETSKEVLDDLARSVKERPEVWGQHGGDLARTFIPGPWGEVLAALLGGGAAYAASVRKAKVVADESAQRVNKERDEARRRRGEVTGDTRQSARAMLEDGK